MAKSSMPNLNGNLLTESFDIKEIFLIQNGKEQKAGTTTEKLKYIEVNGHEAIERVQTLSSSIIGNRKGVTVVDRHTLKPISFTDFVDGVQKHKALYKNDAVHITDENNRESVQTLNHSFDTFSVEMILKVLPLKEGYSIENFKDLILFLLQQLISMLRQLDWKGLSETLQTWPMPGKSKPSLVTPFNTIGLIPSRESC
ncbi:hypothetical protein ACQCVP_04650 [Rossellomorea vietnamensis]|uniref:hypothetical protein n=1 Tax=Rossellomorea vietnamensis TaxID=218284 RepID=UPI003CEB4F97